MRKKCSDVIKGQATNRGASYIAKGQTRLKKNTSFGPGRRSILSLSGLLPLALALANKNPPVLAQNTGGTSALTDVGLDYARIRASLDGRPCYWLSQGIKYVFSDYELIPIHQFSMLEGITSRKLKDDSYIFRILEAPFASDLVSGEVVDAFTNPLTSSEVPIPHVQPLSLSYATDKEGNLTIPEEDPRLDKVEFSGRIEQLNTFSKEVLSQETFVTRGSPAKTSKEKPTLTELINYGANVASLDDEGLAYSEGRKSISVYRNGLEGPSINGVPPMLLAFYEGRKYLRFDDAVSETGEKKMEKIHPGFLERLRNFS